jgi:uncharacterized membrane protein
MRDSIKKTFGRFRQLEYLYALIALIFGLIFIAIIPPGWSPDEPQHYWRSQSLSHGNVFADRYAGSESSYAGGPLSQNAKDFINSYGGTADPAWPNTKLNFPMTQNPNVFVGHTDSGETVPVIFSATSKNTPFVYLPYIIAMWIGNAIGLPLLASFIFAKILGLLTLIVAFFFAIRIIPKGKWLVFTLGLLPTTIVQATAITADVMTLSVCILFTALVVREALSKKPISRNTYAILLALIAGIGLVKASYLPIAGLLVIIPIMRKEYRKPKLLLIIGSLVIACAIPGLLWLRSVLSIPDYYPGNVSPSDQLHGILQAPWNFVSVIFATYLSDAQQIIHRGFFGSFIWDTVQLPLVFNFAGIVALTLSALVVSVRENVKISLSVMSKIVMWSIFALLSVTITYALYIYYTSVGAASAKGIQGRYFLPFALLPLLSVHSSLIPLRQSFRVKLVIIGLLVSMLIAAVAVIIERIYV